MLAYRAIALALAVTFAVVGAVFLLAPGVVVSLFAWVSAPGGLPPMPAVEVESVLFRALGAAYMYVVTILAWMMFREPTEPRWATLLAHAKLASAAISLILFVAAGQYLICAANAVVDGAIGAVVILLGRQAAGRPRPERPGAS